MDKNQLRSLLAAFVEDMEKQPYNELRKLLSESVYRSEGIPSQDGFYQLTASAIVDDAKSGAIRVIASIDDGGWRAFFPISSGFVKRSDETTQPT